MIAKNKLILSNLPNYKNATNNAKNKSSTNKKKPNKKNKNLIKSKTKLNATKSTKISFAKPATSQTTLDPTSSMNSLACPF